MATIAFTAIGAAAGPAGAMIGSMIGGYVDNRWLFPAIFGQPEIEAPRLGDIALQMASEGSPKHYCIGPENRIAGTVIWISDLIEVKNQEEVEGGGKGGGGHSQSVTTYSYFVDIAVALCEGEIQSVQEIWADGKLLYDADPDINISSNQLTATVRQHWRSTFSLWSSGFRVPFLWRLGLVITSPDGGPDLSQFKSGEDVVVAGWTETDYNGTFRCKSAATLDSGATELVLELPVTASTSGEAAGNTITLDQDLPGFSAQRVESVTVYTGSGSQDPDDLIEAYEGTGDVPAFRHTAYVVLKRLALADFGNRPPQLSFLVKKDTSKTIGSAIGDLLKRTGLVAAQYDVSALSGNVRGYAIPGPQATKSILKPLMLAHNVVMTESEGKLVFKHRDSLDTETPDADDLAAHDAGQDAPRPAQISDVMGVDFPGEVNVQFIDPANNYQQGSQRERRINSPTSSTVAVNLPMVMTAQTARELAMRELWAPWINRQVVEFALPPSYGHIQVNDLVALTLEGESYTVLVRKIDRGHNHLLLLEGVVEETSVHSQTGSADSLDLDEPVIYMPPTVLLQVLDLPPMTEADTLRFGVYVGMCLHDRTATWLGATLYSSLDDVNFIRDRADRGFQQAVMGEVDGAVAAGPHGYWDRTNTVTVRLYNGELESKTEIEVLNGANRAALGTEIIAFQTATLVSDYTYQLSTLLRGLRNTENDMVHSDGDAFVLLSSAGIQFKEYDASAAGATRYFKAVAATADVDDIASQGELIYGLTRRPFAPCHIETSWDGSNNLTIDWQRRSRVPFRLFGPLAAPLLETTEAYEIDILDGGDNVLRTISAGSSKTATYTAAQQTADGLTPGDALTFQIFQIGDDVGRGRVAEVDVAAA